MNDFVIIADSTVDMPQSMADTLDVKVIPMQFTIGEESRYHYLDNREMDMADFFERMRNGQISSTAQVNMATFYEWFEPVVMEGRDILYVSLSSGLSNSYNTACIVANELEDKYPGRRIRVCDSVSASMGEGLLVYYAAQEKNGGRSLDEVFEFVENIKNKIVHFVTVDNLVYLKRGGRLSAASAVVGTILSIKPLIHIDESGKLLSGAKVKGRKASMDALANNLIENIENPEEQLVAIIHADCEEDAKRIRDMVKSKVKAKEFMISGIGPVIGAHVGPGALAVMYLAKSR